MDFTIKGNNNEVSVSKDTIKKLIELLQHVDCTCVWSEHDNQYIKVNDIPNNIVEELIVKLKLSK